MAGNALINISDKQNWGSSQGFIITLDLEKMNFSELARKMQKKHYFKK